MDRMLHLFGFGNERIPFSYLQIPYSPSPPPPPIPQMDEAKVMNNLEPSKVDDSVWMSIFRYVDQEKDRMGILLTCKKLNKIGIAVLDHSIKGGEYLRRIAELGISSKIPELLKNFTVDPSANGNEAIILASERGHFETVIELLKDDRVDPDANFSSPMHWMIHHDNWDALAKILDRPRKDQSLIMKFAMEQCVREDHPELLEKLLADDRTRIRGTWTEINLWFTTCESGRLECLKKLLACDKTSPDTDDNVAVRITSKSGYLGCLEILLADERIDAGTRDDEAIVEASRKGLGDIVIELLGRSDVDPLARDNIVLFNMCGFGRSYVVEKLLAFQCADPSANENSPLMTSLENCHYDVAKMLLEDPRIKDLATTHVRKSMETLSERISPLYDGPFYLRPYPYEVPTALSILEIYEKITGLKDHRHKRNLNTL